jgi:hypothetical protein
MKRKTLGLIWLVFIFTPVIYAQSKDSRRPNPWKGYKKGTWVHYKHTKGPENKPDMESKTVLIHPGNKNYYKSKTSVNTGKDWFEGKTSKTILKKGKAKPGYVLKEEKATKEIATPAGTFQCEWHKTTTKDGYTESWKSDKVPNLFVKLVSVFNNRRSTMVLYDYSESGGAKRKVRPQTGD